jgi:hypothetical protein
LFPPNIKARLAIKKLIEGISIASRGNHTAHFKCVADISQCLVSKNEYLDRHHLSTSFLFYYEKCGSNFRMLLPPAATSFCSAQF